MSHDQGRFEGEPASFDTDIAIVGMAGRFPGAADIDAYWRNLRGGVESIETFTDDALLAAGVSPRLIADPDYVRTGAPLADMEMFDPALFGLTPREAAIMDPQHRHFLECAWAALENAGHDVDRFAGPIGVFAGSGHNAYLPYNLLTNPDLVKSTGFFLLRHTGNDKDFLTTRASYLLNLSGPSVAVQTACSTSLVAIHLAYQSLLANECDMALAGGVTIELPHRHGYLHEPGGILSPDGHCRPFDAQSAGTVFGSGVGIVVLRRLADAIESGDHIYAVVKGTAINNDGSRKVGYLAPSVDGQAHAILEALTVAGVEPDTVGYVEAHGTGTPVGDPIEVAALSQAYRQGTDATGYCAIGSVKGNIGHLDTAAGVAGVIKVAMALHHGELPPSINYTAPNAACGFDGSPFYVNDRLRPWPAAAARAPRRAGVSSLGVGGTNAHLILEQAPTRRPAPAAAPRPRLLALSAASASALDAATLALGEHLAAHPSLDLADVEYTLQAGRRLLAHRRVCVVADRDDAIAVLGGGAPDRLVTRTATGAKRNVAFLFAGGGAQHPDMGRDLYRTEPVFRDAIDRCLALLVEQCGVDIRPALYPEAHEAASAAAAMERPSVGLPALFAVQYAQAQLWRSWGVTPTGMIGHSMGEYLAAHLAGVFGLADALRLVHYRGTLFETLPPGAMLSVPMAAADLAPMIPAGLSVAAMNGPASTVVSGACAGIATLRAALEAIEVPSSQLRIAVAAHSAMLDPVLPKFAAFLATIRFSAPTLPFVSSRTGTWITPAEAQDPRYWVAHLREPVRFHDGLAQILKDETLDLLEVGPGRTLTSLALQHPARATSQVAINSSRHPDEAVSDVDHMLGALGRLWAAGTTTRFAALLAKAGRRRVPLPTYRFDRQRHWIEPGIGAATDDAQAAGGKRADIGEWFYRPTWHQTQIAPATSAPGHILVFADDRGLGERLAQTARARGADVVTVTAGRRFARIDRDRFVVRADVPGDHVALLAALVGEARVPAQIHHLWSVTGPERGDVFRAADRAQALGFTSLLHLAQALGAEDVASPVALVVVSDGMQRVGGEAAPSPAKATLLGPTRVIPRELPNVRATSVDIALPAAGSHAEAATIDALLAEPDAPDAAETVALRHGERWVQRFDAVAVPEAAPALRAGGTYVITGGLGGLALAVAQHLATGVAHPTCALITRTESPPRENWARLIDSGDAIAPKLRAVLALEKAGAQVVLIAADVTDPRAMRRAIRRIRARFGRVDGVFHTAGVLDDGVLQLKDAAAARRILAPKVRGTLALHAALADGDAPDFVMLFSSVSAMLGLPGQIDYAGANAFLDAFAQAQVAGDRGRILSVDWSQWQEIGMAAALARGGWAPEPTGGPGRHPWIDRCLRETPTDRLYVTRFAPARHWLLDEHRTLAGDALIPGTGFLEIARAAASEVVSAGTPELANVLFLEPFFVADGAERELFVHFVADGAGGWTFAMTSEAGTSEAGGATVTHVRGSLRMATPAEPDRVAALAIRARCVDTGAVAASAHMRFGPRWHNVVRIDRGEGEALIELALPPTDPAEQAAFALHPALFDMATAGAQMLIPGVDPAAAFFIPASYDRIRLFRPLAGPVFSHVRLRADASGEDLAVFDVTVADARGQVLADVRGFTMIRVRDAATLARPVAAEARGAGAHEAGILPGEGMRVIDRLLAGAVGPQVIVSPQPFAGVLAEARAAPPPKAARAAERAGADVEPMTATEAMIAGLWEEMLGVDRVGPTDHFFDLGGHSLLAVQFVNKLRKRLGGAVAATALVQAPTVRQLAALVAPDDVELSGDGAGDAPVPAPARLSGEEAVCIRAGGCATPLFLVHDGLGEILLYRTLATRIDATRAVYGLPPTIRADGSIVETGLVEMAAAHIAKLRRVQPHGPYLLAGLCAGGVIAVEMARQLEDAGEAVWYVGIVDAADVEARERPFFVTRARMKRFVRSLSAADTGAVDSGVIAQAAGRIGRFVSYEVGERARQVRTRRAVNRLRSIAREAVLVPEVTAAPIAATPFLDVYKLAHREHRPSGVLIGASVVLYRATHGTGAPDDMPFFEQFADDALGWRRRVAQGVLVVPVSGGHVSALQEPHVAGLARAMQDGIDAAIARGGGDGGVAPVEAPRALDLQLVAP